MPRPKKLTVDYFPHMTVHGKTIMILMNEYGNDGYAFWFQLLELLCVSEGQSYNFETPAAWKLMLAKTHSTDINANGILKLLSEIGAIDLDLYEHNIVWVQNLVDNLDPMYSRRDAGKPSKPSYNGHKPHLNGVIADSNQVIADSNTYNHSRERERTNHSIERYFEVFWKEYPRKMSKGQAEKAFKKINPDENKFSEIILAIQKSKKSDQWLKDNGKFIPYPATWLNAKGWEDEISNNDKPESKPKYETKK